MIHILHLSDIHLGTLSKALQYRVQLETDLDRELQMDRLEYLVISGDIATRSTEAEYHVALDFAKKLIGYLGLDSSRVIVVPGNHDLNWDISAQAYDYIPKHRLPVELTREHISAGDAGALQCDGDRYKQRFANFSKCFYREIYGKDYPLDYEEQSILYPSPNPTEHVLFLGLNSCWELDHNYQGRASINTAAVNNAIDQLITAKRYGYPKEKEGELEPQGNKYEGWLKIVVCHHPITGREMMDDAVMQLLAIHDFKMLLHGHVHEAIEDFYKYDPERGIHIIGAGTFGAPVKEQVPSIPLQYNLLTYDPEASTVTVETRKKEKPDGDWKADARWGNSNNPVPRYTIRLK